MILAPGTLLTFPTIDPAFEDVKPDCFNQGHAILKKLLVKYPKFSGWCTYMNKKGHLQQRSFRNGRENTYGE